jgi:hypothetical protein
MPRSRRPYPEYRRGSSPRTSASSSRRCVPSATPTQPISCSAISAPCVPTHCAWPSSDIRPDPKLGRMVWRWPTGSTGRARCCIILTGARSTPRSPSERAGGRWPCSPRSDRSAIAPSPRASSPRSSANCLISVGSMAKRRLGAQSNAMLLWPDKPSAQPSTKAGQPQCCRCSGSIRKSVDPCSSQARRH